MKPLLKPPSEGLGVDRLLGKAHLQGMMPEQQSKRKES
jgi:hypothetical protein